MASVSVVPSRGFVTATLSVWQNSTGSSLTNKTTVFWSVTISKGTKTWDTSWAGWGKNIYATIDITGLGSQKIYIPTYNYNGSVKPGSTVGSGSFEIEHNSDGTKSISFGISFTDNANGNNNGSYYTPGNASAKYSSMTLTTIPRYATINSFNLSAVNETSIQVSYSTDVTCDAIRYALNDGDWVTASSNPFTISSLKANTSYNVKIGVKRKDSQLWTNSGNKTISTYAYPYIISTPNFTIGEALTITIYNPLKRSCVISVITDDNIKHLAGTMTSTTISPFNNDGWKNLWYSSIPNKTYGVYKANITCTTGNVDQTSSGAKYYINTSDNTFNPTFDLNNIINVKNTLNTDISGDNKFIKGHNNLIGTIKPMTANKFANGSYYNISANSLPTVKKDYATSNIDFVLGNLITDIFNITAVDSRGFSTTVSKSIDLIDYNKPGISNSKIVHQNGIGEKVILSFSGVYCHWEGLLKDNLIKTIKYRIGSTGSYKALPTSAVLTSTNGIWVVNVTLDDSFKVDTQYELYLQISDLLETIETGPYIIPTADAFVWKDLANKRIGINKKPNKTLDIAGDIEASDGIKAGGEITGASIKGDALYINDIKTIWYE